MEKDFSVDWFSNNIPVWDDIFTQLKLKGKDDLTFLEIGCFEGRATTYMLDNILTGKNCKIHVVDTFQGTIEESGMNWDENYEFQKLYDRFVNNISDHKEKVIIHRGKSGEILKREFENNTFDFIYIDGAHTAPLVLQDAILAHPLLKVNGVLIFDDFAWKDPKNLDPTNSPELGIKSFYENFGRSYHVLFTGYQVGLFKTSE